MTEARASILPLLMVLIPALCAALVPLVSRKKNRPVAIAAVAGAGLNLALVAIGFAGRTVFERAWAYWEMDFVLATSARACAVLTVLALLALGLALVALLRQREACPGETALGLLTLALVNGAVLSENLVAMLFFWQALWIPVFLMPLIVGGNAYKTAFRALATLAVTDLSLMFGIGLAGFLAESMGMGAIGKTGAMATAALSMMALGAIGKMGVFPFHGWRARAVADAPTGLNALIPGAADLLLGAYLLIRLEEMFPGAHATPVAWCLGALGIAGMVVSIAGFVKRRSAADVTAFCAGAVCAVWLLGSEGLTLAAALAFSAASCASHVLLGARGAGAWLDPAGAAGVVVRAGSVVALKVNDAISWVYDVAIPACVSGLSLAVRRVHNGNPARYVVWVLAGAVVTALLYHFA